MSSFAHRIGIKLAVVHAAVFICAAAYSLLSTDPWAGLVWNYFSWIDFPISLLNRLFGERYYEWLDNHASGFDLFLYPPHLVHGIAGTAWWYLLPRLVLSKRNGGVWPGDRVTDKTTPP